MRDALKLQRRPQTRTFSVEELLQLAVEGRVRIPEFQRPQRWRASHVKSLFDSVVRGFPIGQLLFAEMDAPAGRVRFGRARISAPAQPQALFLIDGQQRMAALVGALLHPSSHPRTDNHAIWYDLEAESFERLVRGEPPQHWIPLNVVGDSFKLLSWLDAWPLHRERPELAKRAIALSKALREFQIPATIVLDASEPTLRLIFKRVNTSGVAMGEADVFEALYGQPGRPVTAACARIAEMGFGHPHEELFVSALKAVENIDPRRSFLDSKRELEVSENAVDRTEAALQRTIGFFVDAVGIPHLDLLPFTLPLILLARFFHLYPAVEPRSELLLVRWVWRGILSTDHANDNADRVATLQRKMTGDPAVVVEALNASLDSDIMIPGATTQWNEDSSPTSVCALALLALGPQDPATGLPVSFDSLQERLEEETLLHMFVPIPQPTVGSRALNQFFVADPAALTHLLSVDAPVSDAVLASHALDRAMLAAYNAGDISGFELARMERLNWQIIRFCRERAGLDESDRPSIAAIVARAEAEAAK